MRSSIDRVLVTLMLTLTMLAGAGCAQTPLPAALVAPTPQSCGNSCAALNCPSAYTCRVDANCAAHCEPEHTGGKPF